MTLNPFVEGDDVTKRMAVSATSRDTVLIAPPWPLVIVIALVVLYILFSKWRRRADAKRAAVWMAHTEQEARRKIEAERAGDLVDAGSARGGSEP